MTTSSSRGVTQLLLDWSRGDGKALDELMPLVYDELRKLANSYLRRERPDHTLQPTSLVHEAYLRLVDQRHVQWQNRAHFFGIAAQMMRRILVDHAKYHAREKRLSLSRKVSLDDAIAASEPPDIDVLVLDHALNQLAALDQQQARVVELRFFSGLTVEETAEVLGISLATVKRDWSMAKAWLYGQLRNADFGQRSALNWIENDADTP
jgi:RNA polymerase sigma factor (TIGR02999 family)